MRNCKNKNEGSGKKGNRWSKRFSLTPCYGKLQNILNSLDIMTPLRLQTLSCSTTWVTWHSGMWTSMDQLSFQHFSSSLVSASLSSMGRRGCQAMESLSCSGWQSKPWQFLQTFLKQLCLGCFPLTTLQIFLPFFAGWSDDILLSLILYFFL